MYGYDVPQVDRVGVSADKGKRERWTPRARSRRLINCPCDDAREPDISESELQEDGHYQQSESDEEADNQDPQLSGLAKRIHIKMLEVP